MSDWKAAMQTYHQAVEQALDSYFQETLPQGELFAAMRYSLLAGGKRIRPILTLEFCRVCGGDWQAAMPFACAVEMVHTYSLIHDDLPCMDNDDFRRGKPTNHKVYGQATAVLAGDALLTAAFETAAGAQLPPDRIVKAVQTLAQRAGELGMVGGQMLDIEGEQRAFTAEQIHLVQSLKTGALLTAACELGAICAGAAEPQRQAAVRYAQAVGLAFQMQDDILDVEGSFEKLGKATGMDTNKNTFVRLYGIARCREMVQEQTQLAIDALQCFEAPGILEQLARYLASRDS